MTGQERFQANLAWVRHWFPRRHWHPTARRAARWAITNAKATRWLAGGPYPHALKGKP